MTIYLSCVVSVKVMSLHKTKPSKARQKQQQEPAKVMGWMGREEPSGPCRRQLRQDLRVSVRNLELSRKWRKRE